MTILFRKVVIVGPGLIGGSLGIALRRRKLAKTVLGVARSAQHLKPRSGWARSIPAARC